MRSFHPTLVLLVGALPLITSVAHSRSARAMPARSGRSALSRLPVCFEANEGQFPEEVRFRAHGGGGSLYLAATEAVIPLPSTDPQPDPHTRHKPAKHPAQPIPPPGSSISSALHIRLVGANPNPRVTGEEPLPTRLNYLIGNDPKRWRHHVRAYGRVRYHDVYPGIDLVYYGSGFRAAREDQPLEYDFIVRPGADPAQIRMTFVGTEQTVVDTAGDLVLRAAGREVRQRRPVVYQDDPRGRRREVACGYDLQAGSSGSTPEAGFRLGAYDTARTLIVDPTLVYSTYLGGSGDDIPYAIAVDAGGSAYVAGTTTSINFPVKEAAFRQNGGDFDAFVAKLTPDGAHLEYATYLGGVFEDVAQTVAVDAKGNAYVAGHTLSSDFPITPDAFQSTSSGAMAFIAKLSPNGGSLAYATFLGGSDETQVSALAVDTAGNAYLAGRTWSPDFPVTPGTFQPQFGGGVNGDGFIAKLAPDGGHLVYATYLGGSGDDFAAAIAIDASGNAYVAGDTSSTDFPVTSGAFQPQPGGNYFDGFVVKLAPDGRSLVYGTYLGGSGDLDSVYGVAVDSAGSAYVTGITNSVDFPVTQSAFQPHYGGGNYDGYIVKLAPDGGSLVYGTYLGGSADDWTLGIAIDSSGVAYVGGTSNSANFPVTPDALQHQRGGSTLDVTVVKLAPDGGSLLYATYLGSSTGDDLGAAVAIDNRGTAYLAGMTSSADFPVTPLAFQRRFGGGSYDAFVTKLATAGGNVRLSPASVSCGKVPRGQTGSGRFSVFNSSTTQPLLVSVSMPAASPFSLGLERSGVTIPPRGSLLVTVTFHPTQKGRARTRLSITTSDPRKKTVFVQLNGTGT